MLLRYDLVDFVYMAIDINVMGLLEERVKEFFRGYILCGDLVILIVYLIGILGNNV